MILGSAPPTSRKILNWLKSWEEYTNALNSPLIFRRWAGIAVLSAVMERKLWVHTQGSNLYPNLYTVLVGPPGVGKSAVLSKVDELLRSLPDIHVAPSSVSAASLVDSLALSNRVLTLYGQIPPTVHFHYLTAVCSEFGVFLPAYDNQFMNSLTKFYDGELYEERRRTGKVQHTKLENTQLSILGGTTPSYLNALLPEGAWDQGFTSRTIFIYCGVKTHRPFTIEKKAESERREALYKDLVHDLKSIGGLYGKFEWTEEAFNGMYHWNEAKLAPVPEHNKLIHYNERRLAHCIKLCMIASISRNNGRVIDVEDYQSALDWLLEAEAEMLDLFHAKGVAGDSAAIDDTFDYIYRLFQKEKAPISESRVMNFLRSKVPSHSVLRVIEVMTRSGLIILEIVSGRNHYRPGSKGD